MFFPFLSFFFFFVSSLIYHVSIDIDLEGRLISCDLIFRNLNWRFICLYVPTTPNARCSFFELLPPLFDTDGALVVMEDFNCVCSAEDRTTMPTNLDASEAILQTMLQDNVLVDLACGKDELIQYTHFQGASHALLDRIYVSGNLYHFINVKPIFFSDHCLVSACNGPRRQRFPRKQWEL